MDSWRRVGRQSSLTVIMDCAEKAGLCVEWADLMRDLDRLQQATVEKDGKRITVRTPVSGQVGNVFKAVGVALPAKYARDGRLNHAETTKSAENVVV